MNMLSGLFNSNSSPAQGVLDFRDWRFYLAALLLAGGTLCLIRDPYFIVNGEFEFRQGVVVLLLALVIGSAFTWETPIFGRPAGANLLLQSFAMVPFALFVTRLCATDGGSSPDLTPPRGSSPWDIFALSMNNLLSLIPGWILEIFRNWRVLLLFLIVLAILCLRRVILRSAAIVLTLLILLACQINRGGDLKWLAWGMLLLIAALAVMFCRYDRMSYYENILLRIRRGGELGAEELRAMLLIMAQLEQGGRISESGFRQIVKNCYAAEGRYDDGEITLISGEVAKRMILVHRLVTLHNDGDGVFMSPDPLLLFYHDSLLGAISTLPRIVFACAFALLWVLLPIDLIPDALPFVGTLDDIAVAVLGFVVTQRTAQPLRRRDE